MMKINIVTVIQARTGSTRMPNKVLYPLGDTNVLLYMVNRIKHSKLYGNLIIATTNNITDDPIEILSNSNNIPVFRGSEYDLLDRHYKAALPLNPDAVVKIPSDCPLIDPSVIDKVIGFYIENFDKFDYVSNLHPQSYPDGNDVEIFSFRALETAWKEAERDFEREHTTPYFWENPDRFRIGNVEWETGLDLSMSHRWTLDYPQDYGLIRKVVDHLHWQNPFFSVNDIVKFLDANHDIMGINQNYLGVNWYRNHLDELKTIDNSKTKQIEKI